MTVTTGFSLLALNMQLGLKLKVTSILNSFNTRVLTTLGLICGSYPDCCCFPPGFRAACRARVPAAVRTCPRLCGGLPPRSSYQPHCAERGRVHPRGMEDRPWSVLKPTAGSSYHQASCVTAASSIQNTQIIIILSNYLESQYHHHP